MRSHEGGGSNRPRLKPSARKGLGENLGSVSWKQGVTFLTRQHLQKFDSAKGETVSTFERLLILMEGQPLSRSLPVSLQIANTIADEGWASWIRLELMGYLADNPAMENSTIVPEYRAVTGSWYDDYGSLLILDDPNLAFINEIRLRHGVAELEGIAAGTGILSMRPTEFSELIRNNLKVDVCIFRFSPSSVCQVLTNVKVRLIDQLASRRDKIDVIPDIQSREDPEIFQLKPGVHGLSVDLKALWRKLFTTKK